MSIMLPKHLQSIGEEAFAGCSALSGELVAPDSLTEIGRGAFAGCYDIASARYAEPYELPEDPDEQEVGS